MFSASFDVPIAAASVVKESLVYEFRQPMLTTYAPGSGINDATLGIGKPNVNRSLVSNNPKSLFEYKYSRNNNVVDIGDSYVRVSLKLS